MIYLTPGSKIEGVGETINDENGRPMLKVFVSPRPENNKANKAMIEVLASHFRVPKSSIYIKSGHKSRKKLICVIGENGIT
jgi:uncharacterized protein YggU (UPF0235/DUF167 family)